MESLVKWRERRGRCCDWQWNRWNVWWHPTPNTRKSKSTSTTTPAPNSRNVHNERIYACWAYWYSCQVPTKGQGKYPGMVCSATGYRKQWHFSDWEGGRENEQHHIFCPPVAPTWCSSGSRDSFPYGLHYSILQGGLA